MQSLASELIRVVETIQQLETIGHELVRPDATCMVNHGTPWTRKQVWDMLVLSHLLPRLSALVYPMQETWDEKGEALIKGMQHMILENKDVFPTAQSQWVFPCTPAIQVRVSDDTIQTDETKLLGWTSRLETFATTCVLCHTPSIAVSPSSRFPFDKQPPLEAKPTPLLQLADADEATLTTADITIDTPIQTKLAFWKKKLSIT